MLSYSTIVNPNIRALILLQVNNPTSLVTWWVQLFSHESLFNVLSYFWYGTQGLFSCFLKNTQVLFSGNQLFYLLCGRRWWLFRFQTLGRQRKCRRKHVRFCLQFLDIMTMTFIVVLGRKKGISIWKPNTYLKWLEKAVDRWKIQQGIREFL